MNRRQKIVQQRFLDDETQVIKGLEQVYTGALKDIDANIEKLMKRFDPETGDLPQSAIYQLKYQKFLRAQVDDELKRLHKNGYLTVSDYLDDCYTNGFIGSMYDMHGQGVPLAMPIDKDAMVHAVQLDSNISQGMYTKMGVDVDTLRDRITTQVSRGIATGASWQQVAQQLNGEMRIGYNKAVRIARTEGHRIQNQAKMDAMEDALDRGADLLKQWDATLDGKTRDSHSAVDGEFREKDEEFSNGLLFPGDPDGPAAEVINCRCALLMRTWWATGKGFTKMNNFTKQLETFESPEAYDDFKEGFFSPENKKYMNYVQQMEKKYNTRNFPTLLERMNPREYKHYSKLLKGNPLYNKDVAEQILDITSTTTKLKGVMSDADYQAYIDLINRNPAMANLYLTADDINGIKYVPGAGNYSPIDREIKYSYPQQKYIDDGMSRYDTIAHEYGHYFDSLEYEGLTFNERNAVMDAINGEDLYSKASRSDQFLGAMRKDMDAIAANPNDVISYCRTHINTSGGVQDALDGLGFGRVCWGHGDKYYDRFYTKYVKSPLRGDYTMDLKRVYLSFGLDASNQTKVKRIARQYDASSELWANIASAMTTGSGELDAMYKYFPNATKEFMNIIGRVVY